MIARIAAISLLFTLTACEADEPQIATACANVDEIRKQINEDRMGFEPDLVLSMTLDYESRAELGTHTVEPCDVVALDVLIIDEKFNSQFINNWVDHWGGFGELKLVSQVWDEEVIRPPNQNTFERAVFYRRFYVVSSIEDVAWTLYHVRGSFMHGELVRVMSAELKH